MNEVATGWGAPETARDLDATLSQQQLAGAGGTESLAHAFLARVQRDIDEQVDLRVQQRLALWQPPSTSTRTRSPLTPMDVGLILGSLGIAIPLSAIAGDVGGFAGLLVVWVVIALINVAWAQRH